MKKQLLVLAVMLGSAVGMADVLTKHVGTYVGKQTIIFGDFNTPKIKKQKVSVILTINGDGTFEFAGTDIFPLNGSAYIGEARGAFWDPDGLGGNPLSSPFTYKNGKITGKITGAFPNGLFNGNWTDVTYSFKKVN